jgi:two-component system sensor histidine kinase AlgZ
MIAQSLAAPVPREFLWVPLLTLPVVALILAPASHLAWATLAATTLEAIAVGFALQIGSEKLQPLIARRGTVVRAVALAAMGLLVIGAVNGLILPLLVRLWPSLLGQTWALAVRGAAVAALYLTAGCAIARARNRVVAARLHAHAETAAALAARLHMLQARTNPHFLFNSLASISSLVATDPERACAILDRMAGLFRYALESGTRTRASLREELVAVRDYVDVEGVRLGDRLRCSLALDDDVLDVEAPPMILQPLVENAIFHGVEARRGGGSVTMRGSRSGDTITLTVQDDGAEVGAQPSLSRRRGSGTGTSLSSLRERLALAYGKRASLEISRHDGFTVTMRIPV